MTVRVGFCIKVLLPMQQLKAAAMGGVCGSPKPLRLPEGLPITRENVVGSKHGDRGFGHDRYSEGLQRLMEGGGLRQGGFHPDALMLLKDLNGAGHQIVSVVPFKTKMAVGQIGALFADSAISASVVHLSEEKVKDQASALMAAATQLFDESRESRSKGGSKRPLDILVHTDPSVFQRLDELEQCGVTGSSLFPPCRVLLTPVKSSPGVKLSANVVRVRNLDEVRQAIRPFWVSTPAATAAAA